MSSNRKDFQSLLRKLRKQGWRVGPTKGGHLYAVPPEGGQKVYFSFSPSDRRAIANARAFLRRRGVNI